MSEDRLQRLQSLHYLRHMLGRLVLETHATRDVDRERAVHLEDAVIDLRVLIERLEGEIQRLPGTR
jgi:hypothetical protein